MSDECRGLTVEQIAAIDSIVLKLANVLPPKGGAFVLCFQADGQPDGWNFASSNCPSPQLIPFLESWIKAQKRKVS